MAEVNGTNYAKFIAPTPANAMGAEWDGRVIAEHDTYTCNATAVNDTINVGVLRPGECCMFGYIAGANLGANTTLTVGDANDADRFLAATNTNAAFAAVMFRGGAANLAGFKNETANDIPIIATVGGANATGRFDTVIFKTRQ